VFCDRARHSRPSRKEEFAGTGAGELAVSSEPNTSVRPHAEFAKARSVTYYSEYSHTFWRTSAV
jgi:hypothetical protein